LCDKTIGENIKKIRINKKGWTQKKLAEESGITRESVGNYERGDRTPPADILKRIAEALEVDISNLISSDELQRQIFDTNFDTKVFDVNVIKYINKLKEFLTNTFPNVKINNTLIIQNIIIDAMAKKEAEKDAGILKHTVLFEFFESKGNFITGEPLYDMLYKTYLENYKKTKENIIKSEANAILETIKNNKTSTDNEKE